MIVFGSEKAEAFAAMPLNVRQSNTINVMIRRRYDMLKEAERLLVGSQHEENTDQKEFLMHKSSEAVCKAKNLTVRINKIREEMRSYGLS